MDSVTTVYHTTREREIKLRKGGGPSGTSLFFATGIYELSSHAKHVFSLTLDEAKGDIVSACYLEDEESVEQIADTFGVDKETALGLLQAEINEWDLCNDGELPNFPNGGQDLAEASWWLQGVRGSVARKMGYIACEDIDEQGTVIIADLFEREHLLTYRGLIDDFDYDAEHFHEPGADRKNAYGADEYFKVKPDDWTPAQRIAAMVHLSDLKERGEIRTNMSVEDFGAKRHAHFLKTKQETSIEAKQEPPFETDKPKL